MQRMMQWLAPPAAFLVLLGVIFFTSESMKANMKRPPSPVEGKTVSPEVSVLEVDGSSYSAAITGFGEASPNYQVTVTAEVSGRVEELGENFKSGAILSKGDMLLRLDDIEYLAAVATAESDLAQAGLELLEEERQAAQAQAEWESSGLEGEPDSELVLRKPQFAAARAVVKKRQAALKQARRNLAKTTVRAPFDCLIISRLATPGSYLQSGTEIALLHSVDTMEVAIALSSAEWKNLPTSEELQDYAALVKDVESNRSWKGRIDRLEGHIDTATRQRTLVVAVDNPLQQEVPLLAGTFVKVEIAGREVDGLWKLPVSALSQQGKIWYVTDNNSLACFLAKPRFSDREAIYITPPKELSFKRQRVLAQPLSSYMAGMKIKPVVEANNG